MLDDIKKKSAARMDKSVDALKQEYGKLRTGRASAGLIEPIRVDYYGSQTPISQVASVSGRNTLVSRVLLGAALLHQCRSYSSHSFSYEARAAS